MKVFLFFIFLLLLAIGGISFVNSKNVKTPSIQNTSKTSKLTNLIENNKEIPLSKVIVENLDTPWAIGFLPGKNMLITERAGTVKLIETNNNYTVKEIGRVENAKEIGEGGLLGLAIHPEFEKNNYVYFYYTYQQNGQNTLNRVVRMKFQNDKLSDEKIILDKIPGASNHNGGRIRFGPDTNLYITTGDAQKPSLAQNTNSLAGKILRVTDTGEKVIGNNFGNAVFSYGHRNPQGLAWDNEGNLWQTEHGRSRPTGFDEVNLIEKGKNYGWPTIQGNEKKVGMITPLANSGPSTTWAPASAAIIGNSLYFGGLKGTALYEGAISHGSITDIEEHFKNQFGRIREVTVGPDGMIYMTTSNLDGRGMLNPGDDKIIRINPEKLNKK